MSDLDLLINELANSNPNAKAHTEYAMDVMHHEANPVTTDLDDFLMGKHLPELHPANLFFPSPISPSPNNSLRQRSASIPNLTIPMNLGMMEPSFMFDQLTLSATSSSPISSVPSVFVDRKYSLPLTRRSSMPYFPMGYEGSEMGDHLSPLGSGPMRQNHAMRRASVAGSSIFQCNEPGCYRTFNRLQNLKSHARCHLKVSPHTCNVCHHSFRRSTDLARHVRTVHASEEDKPWGCEGCGKRFGRSDALKRHSTSKSKLYGCPVNFSEDGEFVDISGSLAGL